MLDYLAEALVRFQHDAPQKMQDRPHPHINPKYGEKLQYAEEKYFSPLM